LQTLDIVHAVAEASATIPPSNIAAIISAIHSLSQVANVTATRGGQLLATTGTATNRTTQSVAQTTGDQLLDIISNVFYGRFPGQLIRIQYACMDTRRRDWSLLQPQNLLPLRRLEQ
jgi:hypothetical protein